MVEVKRDKIYAMQRVFSANGFRHSRLQCESNESNIYNPLRSTRAHPSKSTVCIYTVEHGTYAIIFRI